jgi:hypothetical protein
MEGLRKVTVERHSFLYPGRVSNRGPPDYEFGVLTTTPRCSAEPPFKENSASERRDEEKLL